MTITLAFYCFCYYVSVLVAQLCPTLCYPMDCSPPASSVHVILQAKIQEWVAIPFSRGSSWPRDQTQVSRIAGRFFTIWATREALPLLYYCDIVGISSKGEWFLFFGKYSLVWTVCPLSLGRVKPAGESIMAKGWIKIAKVDKVGRRCYSRCQDTSSVAIMLWGPGIKFNTSQE